MQHNRKPIQVRAEPLRTRFNRLILLYRWLSSQTEGQHPTLGALEGEDVSLLL